MQKVKLILLMGMIVIAAASFNMKPKEQIQWMSFGEMQEAYAKNPKPILVDMYTDWCGWCKQMDKLTYTNEKVVKYINENYYAVKFDAESKENIIFNNKEYQYNTKYKSNDLALFLSFGRLEFPTTVFLPSIDARPAPLSGYMRPKELEPPLKYFVERVNAEESFVDFSKKMKKEW
jgi:thioredoxin-related protein